ncbi:hypothetical protein GCM10023094_56140 [Rhodococcus olei]|uniref:Uncharacterized protein n=1 Tax=Rhodococcus olei TaxID=2161675 RepID=A0ABP8PRK4_9NOCA
MQTSSLLSIIARIHPQVWDAIVPHGPGIRERSDRASLNPQPLPPSDRYLIGAAEMAHDVARIAVESEMRGQSSSMLGELVDDWCATPWPRRWPWPWPGPRPNEDIEDGPLPEPWVVQTGRVVGAIVFASVGSRLAKGELAAAFLDGADRLTEAAVLDRR